MSGGLFSEYYLLAGIDAGDLPDHVQLRAALRPLLDSFGQLAAPSEVTTEDRLIEPVLRALGWPEWLKRQAIDRDHPDYLLFGSPDTFATANAVAGADRYLHGAAFLEAKAWGIGLDQPGAGAGGGTPSTQMLRYLGRVEVASDSKIRFGILTNGRLWRLYDQKARSRAEDYYEIDLPAAIASADDRRLQLFARFFGVEGFRNGVQAAAVRESRNYEARVTRDLARIVFARMFADLATALRLADPQPNGPKPIARPCAKRPSSTSTGCSSPCTRKTAACYRPGAAPMVCPPCGTLSPTRAITTSPSAIRAPDMMAICAVSGARSIGAIARSASRPTMAGCSYPIVRRSSTERSSRMPRSPRLSTTFRASPTRMPASAVSTTAIYPCSSSARFTKACSNMIWWKWAMDG